MAQPNKNQKKKKKQQNKKSNVGTLVVIASIVVLIFAAIWFLNATSNDKKTSTSTLYGDYKIQQQSTIDQLDDPNYQNIILPEDLDKKIKSGEGTYAYFFSPECEHCQKVTPRLMPIADTADVQIDQFNILEFTEGWSDYNVDATPTLVYYNDGKEVGRIIGDQPDENFEMFFEDMKTQ